MKKLAVVLGMLLTFGLLLTSCGAKGPSYNPMTEKDLEDTAWVKGTWQINIETEFDFDGPEEVKSLYSALLSETEEEIANAKKATYKSLGADETGKLVVDDKNVDMIATVMKAWLKTVCNEEQTMSEGGVEGKAIHRVTLDVTDAKDNVKYEIYEETTASAAGASYSMTSSESIVFEKQ